MEQTKPEARTQDEPDALKAAVRRARVEQAERSEVVAELRGAEIARLEMLFEAFKPILAQVPAELELFDAGITQGERPRLFIGTMEEMFEMWTSASLGFHFKPVVLYDPIGFYRPLLDWVDGLAEQGLVKPEALDCLVVREDLDAALDACEGRR